MSNIDGQRFTAATAGRALSAHGLTQSDIATAFGVPGARKRLFPTPRGGVTLPPTSPLARKAHTLVVTSADAGTDLTAEVDLSSSPPRRTDLHDPSQRAEVERAVCAIPGVLGARVVPGFDRQVDELHVLTSLDRAPKQTVRDVQTVLMARFGVPTDHRVISVVQLDETDTLAATARVVVEQVGLTQSGLAVTAQVVVRNGDDQLTATVEGGSSLSARNRTVGRATLAAIRPLLEGAGIVELEGVELVGLAGAQVAVSVVHVRTDRMELILAGSAVVRETPADAVARSVLDALNRTMAE